MKKHFVITENEQKIIDSTLERNYFLENQSAALRYIIQEYETLRVRQEHERETKIILAIVKCIEDISREMLDAINTMLIVNEQEICYPVDYYESKVLKKSREYAKSKKAHLKQKKDYRNGKKSKE